MKHRALSALALFSLACAPDQAVAPAVSASPLFMVGTTPTNHLLGGTPTLRFSATDGSIAVTVGVNHGILNAAQNGNAGFAIETRFALENEAGQSIVVVGSCPLADVKTNDIDPKSDPVVEIAFPVSWDGNDANGEPMGGDISVNYSFQLAHAVVDPKGDPVLAVGNPLVGTIRLSSGPGDEGPEEGLVDDAPAGHLIGDTPAITYGAAGGGFMVLTGVNRGIFEASHTGEADFQIETRFTSPTKPGRESS